MQIAVSAKARVSGPSKMSSASNTRIVGCRMEDSYLTANFYNAISQAWNLSLPLILSASRMRMPNSQEPT